MLAAFWFLSRMRALWSYVWPGCSTLPDGRVSAFILTIFPATSYWLLATGIFRQASHPKALFARISSSYLKILLATAQEGRK